MSQQIDQPFFRKKRTWRRKFCDAFLGLGQAIIGQSSFFWHFAAAIGAFLAAVILGNFQIVHWCLLVLCVSMVIGMEIMNTAIENLAKAVSLSFDPHLGRALDMASGAVLFVAIGSAVVGILLFGERLTDAFCKVAFF